MAIPKTKNISNAQEPTEGYWAALGEFIHHFSKVERMLHIVLRQQSGADARVCKAVFSGLRNDTCRDYINRVCDAMGRSELKARLKGVFDQLGQISAARNAIVHWGASTLEDDSIVAMNEFLAHTDEKFRQIPLSTVILRSMIDDLIKINIHLAAEVWKMQPADSRNPNLMETIGPTLSSAWRYKPPQQSPLGKGNPNRDQVQPPQTGASLPTP